MKRWLYLIGALVLLTSCAAPAATDAPTTEATQAPTEAPTEAPIEALTGQLVGPSFIEFDSDDGTALVGTFFPAGSEPAPALLLIHQYGMNRDAWKPLTDALADSGYAMFAIDLPAHGESKGTFTDASGLAAIRTALRILKTMEGVDKERIVMIGASVGADGAADECGEGCIGVISFSPGNFMGIKYTDALTTLKERDVPVLCMAAKGDSPSPQTCEQGDTVGLSDYQFMIYDGVLHGNKLVSATDVTPAPAPLDLALTWLEEHLK